MSELAILTTVFSHIDNPYFKNNWEKFSQFLLNSQGLKPENIYICEILEHHQEPIAQIQQANHYTVYNSSHLWHKESGINYLLNKLDNKYDYILVIDNDIIFNNINWHQDTINLLEQYWVVQPFDNLNYYSSGDQQIEFTNLSLCKYCSMHQNYVNGNPGIAVAYHKRYLDFMGGLFDECVVGGADSINILPFFYKTHFIPFNLFERMCIDSRDRMISYVLRAKKFLDNNILKPFTYLKHNTAFHLFHGYIKHRDYNSRYGIINTSHIQDICARDSNNFYSIKDADIMVNLDSFFKKRLSLDLINQPTIIGSSKYGADDTRVLWLAPCENIIINNISKMKIQFHKKIALENLRIVINDNHNLDISELLINGSMEIEIDNPRNISIWADNKPIINNDERFLGLLISYIGIVPSGSVSTEYTDYPLRSVV